MPAIARDSLMTLEAYSKQRNALRAEVIAHKKHRTVQVGEHVTLLFEDEKTVRYQVQEMLRIEKIFEEEGIEGELSAYNPLIPDGSNFKATMLIEYESVAERQRALAKLKGIEDRMFVEVEGQARVYAIADEDLDRENDEKTSAVHFVRFELAEAMKQALKGGAQLKVGCDHPEYLAQVEELPPETLAALLRDLR
jgi:TusA-related sulfurtransferase